MRGGGTTRDVGGDGGEGFEDARVADLALLVEVARRDRDAMVGDNRVVGAEYVG